MIRNYKSGKDPIQFRPKLKKIWHLRVANPDRIFKISRFLCSKIVIICIPVFKTYFAIYEVGRKTDARKF